MALTKNQPSKFEAEPGVAGAETVQQDSGTGEMSYAEVVAARNAEKAAKAAASSAAASTAAEAKADPAVATTTAIAKASASSLTANEVAQKAKQFQKEVADMKGASDFSYGNYAVFKGNNGSIVESGQNGADLGRWAQVRMIAWDEHTELSPGESGDSTKDFVAYSKDGKTIDSVIGEELQGWVGRSCDDYMKYLRDDEEFAKAKSRRFIDTACALLATDSGDGPIGKVIQITLSESSIPAFSRYQQELQDNARCVAMGLPGFTLPEDPFTFFFLRELASKGNNKWTKLKVLTSLPAKL